MPKAYYCISDLHIGGDEALGVCDYEAEFIGFLEQLAASGEDAELIIIGDIFGLWEFTDLEGPAKVDRLMEQFPALFHALQYGGQGLCRQR
jgi:UDP-2,3-diacylglucosamine pyrophosphatase LpxH